MTKIRVEQISSRDAESGKTIIADGEGNAVWDFTTSGSGNQTVPETHIPAEDFYLTGYDAELGLFSSGSIISSGSSAGIEEAPIDGTLYGRKDGNWAEIVGGTSGSHNDLEGIQGGSEEERYHLTAAQHTIAIQPSGVDQDGYLKSEDYNQFKLASSGSGAWYLSDLLDVNSGSPVDGQALIWDNEEDKWTPDNVGNVTNSGSSIDGHLAVFSGTTGKLIKDGGAPGGGGIESAVVSGGTETTDDTYQYNAFTTSGSGLLTVSASGYVDVLVVGGGGGGGGYFSGGGGGGGEVILVKHLYIDANVPILVGTGGVGGIATVGLTDSGINGNYSEFGTFIRAMGGGGGGGSVEGYFEGLGLNGASGGGGGARASKHGGLGWRANQGGISRSGTTAGTGAGGGGGGMTTPGTDGNSSDVGGNGGNGITISEFASFGASGVFGGGGGGGAVTTGGAGGTGGGGHGGETSTNTGITAGTANTGGGGGGAGNTGTSAAAGAPGGTGVVIIRTKL